MQTGVKATKDLRVEPQTRRQTEIKTKQSDTSRAKSGGKAYDLSNISNMDDIIIYEEDESTVLQFDREFLN